MRQTSPPRPSARLALRLLLLQLLPLLSWRSPQRGVNDAGLALAYAFPEHASSDWTGIRQLEEDEQRRVQTQCAGAAWQQEYADLHAWMRSDAVPAHKKRFLTFVCTPGVCGGIGDLFIGLVSAFLVALLQKRALIIDYAYMDTAFVPATPRADWRLTPDVPLMPARPFNPRSPSASVKPGSVVHVNLHNADLPEDAAAFFDRLAPAGNIRLLLNRGLLVALFTRDQPGMRKWRARLEEKGMRLPSAFGCILRFLIKPRPDVEDAVRRYLEILHPDGVPSAALGLHVRTSDARTWKVEKVGERPKLRPEDVRAEMRGARRLFSCAQRLEHFFYGPAVHVKWLLLSSSQALKVAAAQEYGDKVVTTSIFPMHIELKGSDAERADAFRSTAIEWVLLSRCCSRVLFTESGFSKTAALHALHPLGMYMFGRWADSWRDASWRDRCAPEEPTGIEVLGNVTRWSGI